MQPTAHSIERKAHSALVLNRKGPTIHPPISSPTTPPRNFALTPDGTLQRDLDAGAIERLLADGAARLWVDVAGADPEQATMLERVFHFHPLAIEDTLNPQSRVKLDEYDGYLFAAVRVVRFCETTPDDPYDLETFNLYLFIGPNFLVTVHADVVPGLALITETVERNPDLLARGPARLAHAILDAAVDAYFPLLEQYDEFIEDVEERVFAASDDEAIEDIFALRRAVTQLRRYLAPQREVFSVLTNRPTPYLPVDAQLYFRDLYDHTLRINETLDSYRELLGSILESHLSQVSNRLGSAAKGLGVVATVSLPFVVIAGIYGMNFEFIPLAGHRWGFEIMVAVQLAAAVGLLGWLRWKKVI